MELKLSKIPEIKPRSKILFTGLSKSLTILLYAIFIFAFTFIITKHVDFNCDCQDGFAGMFSEFCENFADDHPKADQYHFLSMNNFAKKVTKFDYVFNLLCSFNSSILYSHSTVPINCMKSISLFGHQNESVCSEKMNVILIFSRV